MDSDLHEMEEMEAHYSTASENLEEPVAVDLEPCPICTRTFVPATLAKHIKICEKMATKKRKIFDSSRQRREGTDLADFLPKNFGLPLPKQEPKTSPKAVQSAPLISPKRTEEPTKHTPATQKKSLSSPSSQTAIGSQSAPPKEKEKPKIAPKRSLGLPSEQCPYCERCFGAKAYERHVEWCKEKSRIANIQNSSSLSAAKERLQARTKYRAPCLKTKRAANREKYSGLNCEESTNSLSDGGNGATKPNTEEQKMTMSTSLSSSIMSDGGLSDKYDPFLSAKRQLEELCSPTSPTTPVIPTTPPITKQRTTSLSSSLSSSSNPRNTLNTVKSNFRRTSSLRAPRKTSSRPFFITPTPQKPTIQRGLSDEGPISSNFLKPEEYDEMPVKSVCINDFATTNSPKVIKRDATSNPNRRNLRLNLNKIHDRANNNLPLSKTDSLAVFLKYENETKQVDSPVDLTEKDLKDKTNILSKQTSLKNPSSNITPLSDKENIPSIKESLTNRMENKSSFRESSKNIDQPAKPLVSSKVYPIRLEPLPKPASPKLPSNYPSKETPSSINLSSILDFKDSDYIDPKLINVCDNLPVNVSKLSDSDLTSSSTDSACTTKIINETPNQVQRQSQFQQFHQTSSNRNSTEKRNLLKRQMRLGKNHFLYDMSPDSDPYSEECDKTISMIESNTKLLDSSLNEPSFDDFDFEEFLSSFEHDEDQFPIFKDCKEFLLNRSFNKRCNNLADHSARSPSAMNIDYENDGDKREIFISIETSQNDSSPSPTNPSIHPNDEEMDANANKMQKTEDEQTPGHDEKQDIFENIIDINRNNARNMMKMMERGYSQIDPNLTHTCGTSTNMYPADSDEISSVECYPVRKNTKSKQSADSAYGSLSRHSPTDQRSLRKNPSRNRLQSASSIPEQPPKSKYLQKGEGKQRNRDLSASSSGSDTSLPPIQPQKEKEKHYHDEEPLSKKEIRMSKFCHECGSKFLIAYAKFCMECGVKRIVLE